MRRVWVVEARDKDDTRAKWLPTVFIGLSRDEAREKQREFKINDGFSTRIIRYTPGIPSKYERQSDDR